MPTKKKLHHRKAEWDISDAENTIIEVKADTGRISHNREKRESRTKDRVLYDEELLRAAQSITMQIHMHQGNSLSQPRTKISCRYCSVCEPEKRDTMKTVWSQTAMFHYDFKLETKFPAHEEL